MLFRGYRAMKMVAWKVFLWCCLTPVVGLLALLSEPAHAEDSARQAEVARRGAEVMPFSLEQTQHQFTKTENGGIQRVISRDPLNQEQIRLIRLHLEGLAKNFNKGDFSGPESIHGSDMPGLAQMRSAKPGQLQVSYATEAAGASLTFHSVDILLIKAIHDWFDAQVHDHGHDAMEMHHRHHP